MKFKKIMFVGILLLAIFAIGAVSASDVNDTLVASENQDSVDASEATAEVNNQKIENDVISSSNGEILNAKDNGTFTALKEKINNAEENATITLENDYAYDRYFDDKISINKALTIDGKGYTITGNPYSSIINLYGNNIVLKNINFKDYSGGAIYNNGDNCIISSCNFTNCSVKGYISGVINNEGNNCSIVSCNFTNCSIEYYGGIINSFGFWYNINISNCYFTNCSGKHRAGITLESDKGTINSCYFINCSTTGRYYSMDSIYGSIILAKNSHCDIDDCVFINCHLGYGSLVVSQSYSNITLSNSIFINSTSEEGLPTIYGSVNERDNYKITNCSFINDSKPIYEFYPYTLSNITVNGVKLSSLIETINDVNYIRLNEDIISNIEKLTQRNNMIFDGNGYTLDGQNTGGLRFYGENTTIKNIHFKNSILSLFGKNITVNNCSFTNSFLKIDNGHFNHINNCSFIKCPNSAIDIKEGSYNTINNCSFINGFTTSKGITYEGGAMVIDGGGDDPHSSIYISGPNNLVNNCSFINCSSRQLGGAVYIADSNNIINNSTFVGCYSKVPSLFLFTSYGRGGAIVVNGFNNTINGCDFENCYIYLENYADMGFGGAIYEDGENNSIFNSNFINCSANDGGSGIYCDGIQCHVVNSSFYGCDFVNVHVSNIKVDGADYIPLLNYKKNSSQIDLTNNFKLNFVEAIQTDNMVINGNGNIIECGKYDKLRVCGKNITIENIIFNGVSVIVTSLASNFTILNCSFINCSDMDDGDGAVTVLGDNTHIYNCEFINCAGDCGVAVKIEGLYSIIDKCNFIGCSFNTNSFYGGVIYSKNGHLSIFNSKFVNCSAGKSNYFMGIAIDSRGHNCYVCGCTFINCISECGFPVVHFWHSPATLINSSFYGVSSYNSYPVARWDAPNDALISNITYGKSNSTVKITDKEINGHSVFIKARYTGAYGINVSVINSNDFSLNTDANVNINDNNIEINNLSQGNYILIVKTIPFEDYYPATAHIPVNITKFNATISITKKNETTVGIGVLYNGNPIDSADITYTVGNKTRSTTLKSSNLLVKNLQGTVTFKVIFKGNEYYNPCEKSATLTFKTKVTPIITIAKKNETTLRINVTYNGQYVKSAKITYTVGSKTGTRIISSGLLFKGLLGEVKVKVVFDGNDDYNSCEKSATLYFKGEETPSVTPKIIIPLLDNVSGGDIIPVSLPQDATGKITLDINGERYEFDVLNGESDVKLPDLSNGDYPYTITYSGDSKYSSFTDNGSLKVNKTPVKQVENQTSQENITVVDNSKIVASNVNVVYSAGSYYTITVYGTGGKLADDVSVKVSGKISKSLTTTNGVAKFKINQAPGTYKITITALGKSVTKTVTVKHIVTLKTVTLKKSAKKLTLQATLAKVNGKYLKNKKITFKFNGKKYTAKTNAKGVAKVTIKSTVLKKLKVGKKITYQATYLKDTVKKTVKVKK